MNTQVSPLLDSLFRPGFLKKSGFYGRYQVNGSASCCKSGRIMQAAAEKTHEWMFCHQNNESTRLIKTMFLIINIQESSVKEFFLLEKHQGDFIGGFQLLSCQEI
jgi:hypothetical protein